jgi:hypothetical protein
MVSVGPPYDLWKRQGNVTSYLIHCKLHFKQCGLGPCPANLSGPNILFHVDIAQELNTIYFIGRGFKYTSN